jgi:hypothetical protein
MLILINNLKEGQMISLLSLFTLIHLIGLSLAVGAATLKVIFLFKCRADYSFIPIYIKVAKVITNLIIAGMILLTLSGIGWLIYGYPISTELIIKLVLVSAIWILGPVIDNIVEPKFRQLAPTADQTATQKFLRARNKFMTLEIISTAIFYAIIIMWILTVS